jgi:hypothetical protein
MNDIIIFLQEQISNKRQDMNTYYEIMNKSHIQNQSDKAGAYAALVYAAKSMIDDYNDQINKLKGEYHGS